ncbi:hypothetical protein ACFP65_01845 [Marinilactibacillus sp. GCM10026970]|uniref:hypothetical protein n=1 Tax=Marinilactibacillus sp. GCM10026970 TaxID=3252642 RepID=UPI00360FFD07
MYKKYVCRIMAISIIGGVLASCASDSQASEDISSEIVDKRTSGNEKADQSKDSGEDSTADSSGEVDNSTEESSKNYESPTSNNPSSDISKLKMDTDKVLVPTRFPNKENASVSTNIKKNESNQYTVDYLTYQNQLLAEISGTLYPEAQLAHEDITSFIEGKTISKIEENQTDLGYGIKGYAEGAAGTHYFGWSEGNWQFLIQASSVDQLDLPNIAKQIVEYLEQHYLPAPDDTGLVYIDYPLGSDEVGIDIRWQVQEMVYQMTTSEVPLSALKMMTSIEE